MTATTAARQWVFSFPAPTRLLNMNERLHWRNERARAKAWRTVTTLEPTLVPYRPTDLHRPVVVTITERGAL